MQGHAVKWVNNLTGVSSEKTHAFISSLFFLLQEAWVSKPCFKAWRGAEGGIPSREAAGVEAGSQVWERERLSTVGLGQGGWMLRSQKNTGFRISYGRQRLV